MTHNRKNSANSGSNSSSVPKGLFDSAKQFNLDENESYLGGMIVNY